MATEWILLFDIDGTLLLTGGAGTAGMRRAMFKLFGATDLPDIPMSGRTDFAISRDYLQGLGLPFERYYHSLRHMYVRELAAELAVRRGRLLPGVTRLLDELQVDERFQLGLLTGNGAQAASLKLDTFGIQHHFAFGGFGDWCADRADVARLSWRAARQAASAYDAGLQAVVIGDTPADIECARAIGARVLAVATGGFTSSQLAASKPDWLVENLGNVTATTLEDWLGQPG
ncbi:MAG TPA: haloacid dehalogenase-like hydrolase [Pirellulaceae bacterium]|nr:haloacid dehalogenase-like hydrolase [Pirellulaceae bacterium]